MASNARGRLYVDKDVQRALILQLFRHWLMFVGILTGLLLALEALSAGPQPSPLNYFRLMWNHYAPLYLLIAALFPVFAYDSIKLSHRFVGPIIRLRRAMRQAVAGEPVERVQFRKHDFWHDMAVTFNELVAKLPQPAGESSRPTQAFSVAERELAASSVAETQEQ
jgi:hypothetical protein